MKIEWKKAVKYNGGLCPLCSVQVARYRKPIASNILQSGNKLFCGVCESKVGEVRNAV